MLAPALALSLRKAVGFRNVLVHDYVDIDDDIVVARLTALDDLEDFVREVARQVSDLDI